MTKPITINDLISFPYSGVRECELSPDGRMVAYTHKDTISVFNLEKWDLLESFEGMYPKWSPIRPNEIAFLKQDNSGIWLRKIGETERQLGEAIGEVKNTSLIQNTRTFDWSFDGRFIALIVCKDLSDKEIKEDDQPESIITVCPPLLNYASAIIILNVERNEVILQFESNTGESYEYMAWHPSGDWLTVVSAIEYQNQRNTDWHLFDIDLRSGKQKDRIGPGRNEMLRPKWSPDGKKLALGYSPYSYIHPVRLLCAIMERNSTQINILDNEYFVDTRSNGFFWDRDSQKLFFSGLKGINCHLSYIDTVTGKKEQITNKNGFTHLKGASFDGKKLLTIFRGLTSLPDVNLIFLDSGQFKAVTQFSDQLNKYKLSNAEVVEWQSFDGFALQGVVVPTLGNKMSPEYPTIVDLHGGPTEGGAAIFCSYWHWLASEGFQVFAPDFRGSQQYRWVEPPTQEMDFKDAMSGIDWLSSRRMCNKDRLGVYGFSYGAILGAYAIGKANLFRASVQFGGAYDLRMSYGLGFNTRWNNILAEDIGGRPWEIPYIYESLSPISYVSRVETPALIFMGENDVGYHEGILYVTCLKALGKDVEYVIYKGAGHGFGNKSHRKDHWERTLNWYRRYL